MAAAYLLAPAGPKVNQWCWKVAYDTRKLALRAMNRIGGAPPIQSGEGMLQVWSCPHCRLWHVGHGRRNRL